MNNIIFPFFILASIILSSCNQSHSNHDGHQNHDNHHNHLHAIGQSDELPKINLQDGNSWKVPAHMHLVIKQMQQTSLNPNISIEQKALSLEAQIDELTSNCTMAGEAHDELHKILHPLIDAVEQMSEADAENQMQGFKLVMALLELYDLNFILDED
ncbi:MAG: hypothetical protein H0X62_07525 [Bacteroidetes bacterium]|nr:hypothetical protein [Bacteroidota bacterium]